MGTTLPKNQLLASPDLFLRLFDKTVYVIHRAFLPSITHLHRILIRRSV